MKDIHEIQKDLEELDFISSFLIDRKKYKKDKKKLKKMINKLNKGVTNPLLKEGYDDIYE